MLVIDVLVVGGGPAGMAAALDLAQAGLQVTIVEQERVLGGRWLDYACKAGVDCSRCNVCLGFPLMDEIVSQENITLATGTTVEEVTGQAGSFTINLVATGPRIDWQKCDCCGLCQEACPAGAILPPHLRGLPRAYRLDNSRCLRAGGEDCQACRAACPRTAIELEPASPGPIHARAIVVATGFTPFAAAGLPEYGYGFYPQVMTALELEATLSRGALEVRRWERLAFIQCAGSRSRKLGHDYCSRVCCGYSLRLARALLARQLVREVTIFYMDLQLNDAGLQAIYGELQATPGVKLVRGMPSEIRRGAAGRVSIYYEDLGRGILTTAEFDRVVLAVGITPVEGEILPGLSLERDPTGFLATGDGGNGVQAGVPGVFLAGTCQAPRDIQESIAHARLAAARVGEMLAQTLLPVTGTPAGVMPAPGAYPGQIVPATRFPEDEKTVLEMASRGTAGDVNGTILVVGRGTSALLAARRFLAKGRQVILLDDDGNFDPADPAGSLAGSLWEEITANPLFTYLPGLEVLAVDGDAGAFSIVVGDGRRVLTLQAGAILLAARLAATLPAALVPAAPDGVPVLTQQQLAAALATLEDSSILSQAQVPAGPLVEGTSTSVQQQPGLAGDGPSPAELAGVNALAGLKNGGAIVFWLDVNSDAPPAIHDLAWQNLAALQAKLGPDRPLYFLARQMRVAATPELEALYGRLREAGVLFIKSEEPPAWNGMDLLVRDPTWQPPAVPEESPGAMGHHQLTPGDDQQGSPQPGPGQPVTAATPASPLASATRLSPALLVVGEEMAATPATCRLWQRLGLKAGQGKPDSVSGLDSLYNRTVTTNRKGIFLLAAGREPLAAGEARQAAVLAAAAVLEFLQTEEPEKEGVTFAFRPPDAACAACLTCVRTCPHGAMVVQGKALVRTRSCQGCGICVAECPAHALELPGSTDTDLLQVMATGEVDR
ncbi:FAD-dependent oxidoreductase [Moorella naiadis]|uniref:FAD-dependent oxidoreductase n=1 Tax=Moorella naiadis (nom. illeg.) TaxID=3093670 RepID=UPI003D9CA522